MSTGKKLGCAGSLFGSAVAAFALAGVVGLAVAGGGYWHYSQDLPTIETLRAYHPPTVTVVEDTNGEVLGEIYDQRRYVLPIEDIPPHVKQAFLAAEDANWGRVVMAVGKAGQAADRDKLAIWIGPELVAANGVQAEDYSEERATAHLRQPEVRLRADVGVGEGEATIWTCDLTHGYIEINAGYRS